MDSETKGHPQTEAERHLEQAHSYKEAGKFEDVLRECDAAIEIDPSLAEAYNLMGVAFEELGYVDEAREAYMQAIELDSEYHDPKYNLSCLEGELGDERQLVTIATFSFPAEAHIAKTILDREGIWSFIADDNIITWNWLYSNAVGGVKLQVRQPDVKRALQLLNEKPDGTKALDEELGEDEQREKCPSCQSPLVHYETYNERLVFLSWLLLRFPLPFLKRKWKCSACGHEWKVKR